MIFESLWPLAFLLAVPVVVILYLLVPKGTDTPVSSNLLWKKLFYNEQSKTFWEKFLHNLLMYLQIVILLLIILALMAPFVQRKGTGSTDVVYLIDTSGSMKHLTKGGFVGPNGAGKTTTIRMVCGLMPPTEGTITIHGVDALLHPKEIKKQIGYVPDFFGVYDNLKVSEYMDFYGSMYRMTSREIAAVSNDLLELVNLSDKKEVYVDTLSRGMKQRLCVARALIHNPSLLVLDEPNSGLDPRARVEMKELLQNLRSMGKTIVISSHILSELAEMCNSIGIMDHGKLVEAGNIEDVMEHVFGGNRIVVSVHGEMEPAVRMLKEHPQIRVESVGEKEIHISHAMKEEEIAQLIAQMIQNGIIVTGFYKEEGNLESLFMQLTGGQEDEN